MKKAIRAISILLILAMLLSTAALAVETVTGVESGKRLKSLVIPKPETYTVGVYEPMADGDGPITPEDGVYAFMQCKFYVTFSTETPGEELVYIMKKDAEAVPTEKNLFYIDQLLVSGQKTFILFPKDLEAGDYEIHRTNGGSVNETIATFTVETAEPTQKLGDVDNDGEITTNDAVEVLKSVAEISVIEPDTPKFTAADVNKNKVIDTDDAVQILRYVAEIIHDFD